MTYSALMENGEAGNGGEQSRNDLGQMDVEDACPLGAAKHQEVRGVGLGRIEIEEFGANWNAGDFAMVKPLGGGLEVDGGGLNTLADEAVGEAGNGIGLEGH